MKVVKTLNIFSLMMFALFFSCKETTTESEEDTLSFEESMKAIEERVEKMEQQMIVIKDSLAVGKKTPSAIKNIRDSIREIALAPKAIVDGEFINIEEISKEFLLDIKYATTDNFLKKAVYSCPQCYVRGIVAKALLQANADFIKQGYRIKFYDCYRPYSVQKKMWKIFPKPGYVADPKGGSVHNRGAAVDITLTDIEGNEVDMGSPFDHFGKESHHAYLQLPKEVIANRKLLRSVMEKHGFSTIRAEWWHYNFKSRSGFEISDFRWLCE